MKHLIIATLLTFSFITCALGKNGYKIKVNFKQEVSDSVIYLAHYFAKPMPTIYKTDSAKVINKKSATFELKDSILGGIYMVLFEKNSKFAELILDNGYNLEMTIDTTDLPSNVVFKNSEENSRYSEYSNFLSVYGKRQYELNEGLKTATTAADSQKIREQSNILFKELNLFRKIYAKKYPKTFISKVLLAMETPEVPEGVHYLDNGEVDSSFAYRYYKSNYWKNFDFNDNRLINTPIYDGKLNEYFTKLVLQIPDSINAEADTLLSRTRKSSELFKYTLHWLTNYSINSKIMGMDEVFVHLVENYHMRGDAFWLDSASLAKYEERAKKIAPNVIGNIAPEIILQDVWSLQDVSLNNFKAKYTLLFFWSPECNHCVNEISKIDSVYKESLEKKGVKIFSVPTEGELTAIQKFIEEKKITAWQHSVDANNNTEYRSKFDVYSTPKIYLLDENKKIIGKSLDHSNVLDVLEWTEKRKLNP